MTRTSYRVGSGGLLYFIVGMLILGAAIYTQANLLFWSFGLMVGGFFCSLLLAITTLRKVTVTRLSPGSGVVGEPMVIRYQITNHKRLLPILNLLVREQWGRGEAGWRRTGPLAQRPRQLAARPTGWVLHLGPGQSIQAEATCWPLRRGRLRLETVELYTAFPFGIIGRVLHVPQPAEIIVYPCLYRVSRRLLSTLAQADLTGRKQLDRAGGHEDFFGLRPYREGDSFKIIDWKRTARLDKFITREYTPPSPPKIMLLIDLTATPPPPSRADNDRSAEGDAAWLPPWLRRRRKPSIDPDPADPVERAISLAASLICDAYLHGYKLGLAARGARCGVFPIHHSPPHRARLLEALATLEADAGAPPPMLPCEPSVVIHLGPEERTTGSRGVRLSALNMDHYVREAEGDIELLLTGRAAKAEPPMQRTA